MLYSISVWQDPTEPLMCLWPSQWKRRILLLLCLGPLPKVNCPSLSMRWSTEEVVPHHGLIQLAFRSHLLQAPLFWLDWMLGWSTLLEWEHCLRLELVHGVKSTEWELTTGSVYRVSADIKCTYTCDTHTRITVSACISCMSKIEICSLSCTESLTDPYNIQEAQ